MGKFFNNDDFNNAGVNNDYQTFNSNAQDNADKQNGTVFIIIGIIILLLLLVFGFVFLFINKKYVVSFDTAGGSPIASQTVRRNRVVSKPEPPIKDGYIFIAWDYNGETFDFNTKIVKNTVLVAVWEKVEGEYYVVSFNTDGGGDIPNQIVTETNMLVRPDDPVRDGYMFKGWYLDGVEFNFETQIDRNIELVAQWEKKQSAVVTNTPSQPSQQPSQQPSSQPVTPSTTPSSQPTVVVYGDVNEDGRLSVADQSLLMKHLNAGQVISAGAKKRADINADGKIDNVDVVLIGCILSKHTHFTYVNGSPLTNYILYGDANEDGKVNISDTSTILKHLDGWDVLSKQGKKNADINADGVINQTDAELINKYAAKWNVDAAPPHSPSQG